MSARMVLLAVVVALPWTAARAESTAVKTDTAAVTAAPVADSLKVFTLEELAKYDGKKGQPAYIAADGLIYDVTSAQDWKNGKHQGYTAGKDVTKLMAKSSPHGTKPLKKLKVVGKLAPATEVSK